MDFFGAQEQARRQTRWLVVLFFLAVAGVITAVYLTIMMVLLSSSDVQGASFWNPDLFLVIAAVTSFFIAGGSLYKISALAAGGGEAVAESLGGRRVLRSSGDPLERRLLNVVDEMAIASGVPVPKVYLLDQEPGINAFAAGFTTQQAVVTVTRGCLEQLSRDELQGVVAHEFSHILNGDMRLNLRLIGMLYGILLLTLLGRVLMRGSQGGRSKNSNGIFFFGLALLVIGYIGVFFGNLIKAATSRQREFLADASAVQFTRNPDGIAGALKKIGGFESSAVHHPHAEEASHMFFGEGVSTLFGWFATHPPIEERIRRIDRTFQGELQQQRAAGAFSAGAAAAGFAATGAAAITPQQVTASIGRLVPDHVAYAQHIIESLPQSIRDAIDQPEQARTVIYALLVTEAAAPLPLLQQTLSDEPAAIIDQAASHVPLLQSVGRAAWLPVLELAIPGLDINDGPGVAKLLANTKRLVESDGRVTLFEYMTDALLRAALGGKPGDKGTIHRYPLKAVHEDCVVVLSLLAQLGHRDPAPTRAAFETALTHLNREIAAPLMDRSALSLPGFDQALTRLATLTHRFRAGFIEACAAAITHDGQVTIQEAELLRIIGAKLDCPIPPLMASV